MTEKGKELLHELLNTDELDRISLTLHSIYKLDNGFVAIWRNNKDKKFRRKYFKSPLELGRMLIRDLECSYAEIQGSNIKLGDKK